MQYDEATLNLVAMCSEPDAFVRLLKAGMNDNLFVGTIDSDPKRIFQFTKTWFLRDGTCPQRSVLEGDFPQYFKTQTPPEETFIQPEYVVRTLKNNAIKVKFQDIADDAASRIFTEDADQVEELAKTQQVLSDLYMSVSGSSHITQIADYASEYVQTILARAEDQGQYQESLIKFPYAPMNELWKGMKPRQTACFFGYTGDMKSFTLELMALKNALEGKRVYHCTFENGTEITMNRFAALITAKRLDPGGPNERWDSGLSLSHLETGALTPEERGRLREAEEKLAALPLVLDESPGVDERSVETIFMKARNFNAELIIIDQSTWVSVPDAKFSSKWEIEATKMRRVQEWTNEMEVVTAMATQANRESQKSKKGTGLAHVGLSDEITKSASFVASLEMDKAAASLKVNLLKARGNAAGQTFTMHMQLDGLTRIQPDQPLSFL